MNDPESELEKFDHFTEKGQKKIAEICQAAARVFSEKGYLSATLADVASALGITKGAIFHYFQAKEELLFLILYRHLDSTLSGLKMAVDSGDSVPEKIYIYIRYLILTYKKKQIEFRISLDERVNLPENYLSIIIKKEKEYVGILKPLIKDLFKNVEENPRKLTLITYTLMGMITWPYRWFNPEGKSTPEELAQIIYTIFMGNTQINNRTPKNVCSRRKK